MCCEYLPISTVAVGLKTGQHSVLITDNDLLMPRPRKSLISLSETPYYHCVSRCVRRAFLCGKDKLTGQSYEHRRQWVEDRLLFLGSIFSINICAYAVMSNHTHVVLHVDKDTAVHWSTEQVLHRWHRLHKGTVLTHRYLNAEQRSALTMIEIKTVESAAEVYRNRLYDISWFMRLLNESISRRANKEDKCTGRFWEGRFKSQALMDETALAACMVYVDLNPMRAGIAKTPERSPHTSIKKRLRAIKNNKQPRQLSSLIIYQRKTTRAVLPFHLHDYIQLVKQSGLQLNGVKQRPGSGSLSILQKSQCNLIDWQWLVKNIEAEFTTQISLQAAYKKIERRQRVG